MNEFNQSRSTNLYEIYHLEIRIFDTNYMLANLD